MFQAVLDQALDGEFLDEAGGLEGAEEFGAEGFVFRAAGGGDDRVEVVEAMAHGVARRGGLPRFRRRSRLIWHCRNPFREIKKDQGVSPRCGGEDTLVLSSWERIMAGDRMSRGKDAVSGYERHFVWQAIERMGLAGVARPQRGFRRVCLGRARTGWVEGIYGAKGTERCVLLADLAIRV